MTANGTTNVEAIVIGGSAGALEALELLLAALPAGYPTPLAIVVHLPAVRPSHLAEVLASWTVLRVKEAEDKEPVAPGTIYVAPPDYHLLIERKKTFALSVDPPLHYSRPAIDVLFESAAEAYRERLAGVILTGANEDGARGLAAVARAGGLPVVQAPPGAVARAMPEAAIAATPSTRVLSLTEIAAWLAALAGARRPEELR